MTKSKWLALILLAWPSVILATEYAITPESQLDGAFIGEYLHYFEDKNTQYDIDGIVRNTLCLPWKKGPSPYFSLGFTDSACWFRITLTNQTHSELPLYIEYAYGAIDEVYFFSADKKMAYRAGDTLPFQERPIPFHTPVFSVSVPSKGAVTYYIKVKTSGQFRVKFRIYGFREFHRKMAKDSLLYGIFIATFGIIALINYYLSLMPKASVLEKKLFFKGLLKSLFFSDSNDESAPPPETVFLFLGILSLSTIYHAAYFSGLAYQYLFRYLFFLFPHIANDLFNINALVALLCCNIIARGFSVLRNDRAFQTYLLWVSRLIPLFLAISIFVPYPYSGRIVPSFAIVSVIIGQIWIIYILLRASLPKITKSSISLIGVMLTGSLLEFISGVGLIVTTNGWIEWGIRSLSIGLLFAGVLHNAFYRFYVDRKREVSLYLQQLVKSKKAETEINNKIAHEFLTPVTAIVMGSKRVLKMEEIPESAQKTIQLIADQAKQLRELTRSYLRVVRFDNNQEKFDFKPCDLAGIIDDALSLLQGFNHDPVYMHQILFDKSKAHSNLEVIADRENMTIAIKNIIQNAIKYTPRQGKIMISLSRKKKMVAISIADNGNGISDENKKDIFFPFFQADYQKDFDKGAGLGLTIVNKIIQMHKGKIKVISPLNKELFPGLDLNESRKGTCFEIQIPAIIKGKP